MKLQGSMELAYSSPGVQKNEGVFRKWQGHGVREFRTIVTELPSFEPESARKSGQ
jgi:hypothetical protein